MYNWHRQPHIVMQIDRLIVCVRLRQEPAAVSQGVLLSLLQQLGSDLARLPASVLPWIREAALALDPQVHFVVLECFKPGKSLANVVNDASLVMPARLA